MSEGRKNKWWQEAVVYQIYPRSFKDSSGDGIGDLAGIIEKLDYLQNGKENSLGVDAIWLNPIYTSPQKDFGYDVSDYYNIDPIFGDLRTFDELLKQAHQRGLKVIMDFVPNHTSENHAWFLESRASKSNKKRDWYIWRDGKGKEPPNNWLSVFGGSAWEYDKKTGQYYLHTFLKEQPDLNWRNQEVRQEMLNIMKFWLERGVDGFRTDALYHLVKDAEFRDDPPNPDYVQGRDEPYNSLLHIFSAGRPELLETTETMCSVLENIGGAFMVSESYLAIPEMAKLYKACNNKLHAPLNFNFLSAPWSAKGYKKIVDDFELHLSEDDVPNYVLGNHDRSRVASRLGQKRTRLAAMLLFTLRGMAFVYYGEELGMEDAKIPPEKAKDPWRKNLPGFGVGRDLERTPMQWDDSRFVGFSDKEPWLPFFSSPHLHNVKTESSDESSMLSLYRKLIHFRKKSPALTEGSYQPIESTNHEIFAFCREHEKERLLVVLNFYDKEQKAECNQGQGKLIYSTYLDKKSDDKIDSQTCVLRPYEGCIISF